MLHALRSMGFERTANELEKEHTEQGMGFERAAIGASELGKERNEHVMPRCGSSSH